jgi:L-aminopeptidase/D-esterase-like protein
VRQLPDGFKIGHWTDKRALTGCTVILCPPKTVGGCDVRGSSPGTRELSLLGSDKTMQEVHAVLLTGGSAFGLAAADGVTKYLEEQSIGYGTPWVKVPIVPTAVVFDLNVGSKDIRPTAESGYQACASAVIETIEEGTVGAGTGATVGKWAGMETRMKGGFGCATLSSGDLVVAAVAVVNAVGDVLDESGKILAGACSKDGAWLSEADPLRSFAHSKPVVQSNTTLVAILTNAKMSKVEVNRMAQRGHDGMARAIKPVHTSYDGDVVFGLASGSYIANFDLVAEMGADAVALAIRNGVRKASSVEGIIASESL